MKPQDADGFKGTIGDRTKSLVLEGVAAYVSFNAQCEFAN
jgi:hypothetical protein